MRQMKALTTSLRTNLICVLPLFHIYGLVVANMGLSQGSTITVPRFELEPF